MRHIFLFTAAAMTAISVMANDYPVTSPDGRVQANVSTDGVLKYDVKFNGNVVIDSSSAMLKLGNGKVVGENPKVKKATRRSVDEMMASPFYRADSIRDCFNELTLNLGNDWSVVFRAYNDGVAYRFVTSSKKPQIIVDETVEYNFPTDADAAVPYVRAGSEGDLTSQFMNSFENLYTETTLSQLNNGKLMFLPVTVSEPAGVKVCITESGLENYPGLYLNSTAPSTTLKGVFAPRPKTMEQGGHNRLQMIVTEREDYIARVDSPRGLPWRIAVVTDDDRNLAASNLTYQLAEPSRVADVSWIKPGKVAWDWWNNWNLDGVDFLTGVNNDTYKAYIDFASANGIEYVILDEGWAVNLQADLFQVVDEINLQELVDYAAAKNVGLILWAGYHAFARDMERVCDHYSKMGIKGFKVDFMDRDDQIMTDFNARAAEMAAKYHLVLDLHGTHKPAGLNRTYPNLLNFEGVHGLENTKWAPESFDQVKYDVMVPFLRQVAGPLDYTQGAMLNGSRGNFHPCNSEPMSQGTRCRQLALYVTFDSPLNMLCDSPSNYMREQECTDYIAEIPTVWDETRVLDASMGEYIVTARRKGDKWYIGGITDWTPRDMKVDLSFLPAGKRSATLFRDGVNAHRRGRDYKKETVSVSAETPFNVHVAPGGGFVLIVE